MPGRDAWHVVSTQKRVFIIVLFIFFHFHTPMHIIYHLPGSDKDIKAQRARRAAYRYSKGPKGNLNLPLQVPSLLAILLTAHLLLGSTPFIFINPRTDSTNL